MCVEKYRENFMTVNNNWLEFSNVASSLNYVYELFCFIVKSNIIKIASSIFDKRKKFQ